MINAIFFGAFALIASLWIAGMFSDFESQPLWVRAIVDFIFAGGCISVVLGFAFLMLSKI
jgi:hypothetical protein